MCINYRKYIRCGKNKRKLKIPLFGYSNIQSRNLALISEIHAKLVCLC